LPEGFGELDDLRQNPVHWRDINLSQALVAASFRFHRPCFH